MTHYLKQAVDSVYKTPKKILEIMKNVHKINNDIYITNDEKPKKSDTRLIGANGANGVFDKKIILTTDQDLIKDGIQAIDDEFLEWIVKNPNCERIEVEWVDFSWSYFIKIPKQERKDCPLEDYNPK